MSDRATTSLAHIKDSGEFVLIPDFVVFDEHDEFDENGKLVRRFDRKRLQTIVDRCNKRQDTTGDLAVIAPGHSLENPKSEEDQPPPWGFAADFRLGKYGPDQKLGILCSAYVRKEIHTKDGRTVSGPEHIQTFPRRSPEVWPNHPAIPEHARNSIDWIALLRRSPQRDLGLSVYARSFDARREVIGDTTRSGKLRYQMEAPMPDPVQEPNADVDTNLEGGEGAPAGAPPEGHEEFAKHLDYAMSNHPHLKHLPAMCKKYGMADLSPTNAALPGGEGGDVDPGLMQNQRGGADAQPTKYQIQLQDHEKRLKSQEQALAIEGKRLKVQRYEMALKDLSQEFVFDVAAELDDCVGLDEKAFDKHVERIKRNYSRTPVGGDLPYDAITPAAATEQKLDDPDVERKIHHYMRANPEFCQKYGERSFHEAAKVLKIIS